MKKQIRNLVCGAIIVAGGSGKRFGTGNKLFEKIAGVPVFVRALSPFLNICAGNIVLVVQRKSRDDFKALLSEFIKVDLLRFADAGKCRTQSVKNGLKTLENDKIDFVAIHDAARPLISEKTVLEAFSFAKTEGSALVSAKITDTIKFSNESGEILKTIDRNFLWAAQTPQIFKYPEIFSAYSNSEDGLTFTDDASLMEIHGFKVKVFPSNAPNIKITYKSDLILAELLLSNSKENAS